MSATYIYLLKDPRTLEVKYIGKSNDPNNRVIAHCNPARYKPTHKFNWIKSLRDLGLKPIIEIIEEVPKCSWKEREKFWIKFYLKVGAKLTNCTLGGDGLTFGNSTSFKKGMKSKKVLVFNLLGELIESFESARETEGKYGRGVSNVLRKRQKTNKGYTFVYEEGFNGDVKGLIEWATTKEYSPNSGQFKSGCKSYRAKKVKLFILSTNEILIFDSAKETAKYLKIKPSLVQWGCTNDRLIANKQYKVNYI